MSDAFTDGRRFRVLAVIDDYSRECLALVADTSLFGARVVRELDAIIAERGGKPKTIVSDNGTEFTSMAILKRNAVLITNGCASSHHTLEGGLQCNQTSFITGKSHAA